MEEPVVYKDTDILGLSVLSPDPSLPYLPAFINNILLTP